ncbi:MAG: hypothetical protein CVV05_00770 [Gammaproteobacteria bacterium HGW-Gammaproteobacteria-1]|jgi:ParB/RepB/Spo0J family partition protein|nr:MAG: hypothetical protein CVV05_00770 [Gammaproteobacteria bacterium HGW-Gammaproteobacteria-1]
MSELEDKKPKRVGLGAARKADRFSAPTEAQKEAGRSLHAAQSIDQTLVSHRLLVDEVTSDPKNRPMTKLAPEIVRSGVIPKDAEFYELKVAFLEELRELADSIQAAGGVLQAIIVYRHGAGYRIVCGERRWLASILLGLPDIPAQIRESRPKNLRQLQAMENLQREDVLAWERICSIQDMIEEAAKTEGYTVERAEDLQKLTKKSRAQCQNYYALIKAPDDVQEAMRSGVITSIKQAVKLASINDSGRRADALVAARKGEDWEVVRAPVAPKKKPNPASDKKRVGRQRTKINLGAVENAGVVKRLIAALHPESAMDDVDWDDLDAVQQAWDGVLADLLK